MREQYLGNLLSPLTERDQQDEGVFAFVFTSHVEKSM